MLTKSEGPQPELLIESLAEIAEEVDGNEERDAGIAEGNGLSLLLCLILSALQRKKLWEDAPDHGPWKKGPPPPKN